MLNRFDFRSQTGRFIGGLRLRVWDQGTNDPQTKPAFAGDAI